MVPDANVSASKLFPTPKRSVTAPFVSIVPNVEAVRVVTQEVEQVRPVARFPDANVSASKLFPTPKRSVTAPFVSIVPNVEKPFAS